VTISFCNRTELLPIFIWKFAVTSIPLHLGVGLDVRLGVTKTPHLFPGRPGHPTSLYATLSSGATLKIKFTCPLHGEFYIPWPPRSPDRTTPYDCFLWGYVKDEVYVPPLPRDLHSLASHVARPQSMLLFPLGLC
jgi:hypothetical protein